MEHLAACRRILLARGELHGPSAPNSAEPVHSAATGDSLGARSQALDHRAGDPDLHWHFLSAGQRAARLSRMVVFVALLAVAPDCDRSRPRVGLLPVAPGWARL